MDPRLTAEEAVHRLHELVDLDVGRSDVRYDASVGNQGRADVVVRGGGRIFVLELISNTAGPRVRGAAEQARTMASATAADAIPVVVVAYMGDAGAAACADARVSWLDLSGNAHIVAPGLKVHVEGRPNRFTKRGRPSTVFAPKSARIARQLLMEPGRSFRQRDLARAAYVDEGLTSRVVRRLIEDGFVEREQGALHVRNPGHLLDAWRSAYAFDRHRVIKGHIAARSGDALLQQLAQQIRETRLEYAATGLAAAWLYTRFAGFRLVTIYVSAEPPAPFLHKAGFRQEERGANVWLVNPNDEGVFTGTQANDGIKCVHPVQAYLDLKDQPERASEAAERLREERLQFSTP